MKYCIKKNNYANETLFALPSKWLVCGKISSNNETGPLPIHYLFTTYSLPIHYLFIHFGHDRSKWKGIYKKYEERKKFDDNTREEQEERREAGISWRAVGWGSLD